MLLYNVYYSTGKGRMACDTDVPLSTAILEGLDNTVLWAENTNWDGHHISRDELIELRREARKAARKQADRGKKRLRNLSVPVEYYEQIRRILNLKYTRYSWTPLSRLIGKMDTSKWRRVKKETEEFAISLMIA